MDKYETIQIKTPRLTLKKGDIDDYRKVYEYDFTKLSDINGIFKLEKFNFDNVVNTWLGKSTDEYHVKNKEKHIFDWIIYLKDNNQPIGNIVADRENLKMNSIQLGFNLHPNYWGHGYMPEAVSWVMYYLFSLGYESIICGYYEGNIKSQRVAEKLGFTFYKKGEGALVKDNKPMITYNMIMNRAIWLSSHQINGWEENENKVRL